MQKLTTLILCFFTFPGFSQQHGGPLIDSLRKAIHPGLHDTLKVDIYIRIADSYIDIDLAKAALYGDSALQLAEKAGWEAGVARSQINFGNIYNFTGEYNKAVAQTAKAYAYFSKTGDLKSKGTAAYTQGVSFERLSEYAKAADKYFEALHIFEKIKGADRLTGNSLSAISVIYFLQRDYPKSLEYSFKALAKQESARNTPGIANEYVAIADTYDQLRDSANAIRYNLLALGMQQKMGNKFGEAVVYFQLGKLFGNHYRQSLDYHFKSEKLFSELNNNSTFRLFNRGEIGRKYFALARMDKIPDSILAAGNIPSDKAGLLKLSATYITEAIAQSRESGDKDNESSLTEVLAELQAYNGDFKNAYLNYRLFHITQDSIYSQQNKNKIAALESQKEIDLKNKTIENNELQLKNQRNRLLLSGGGILVLVIIGGLLYRQNRLRKKTNIALSQLNHELDEANKVKARFFGILSHDLRSPVANLINFLQLQKRQPGLLTEEQKNDREEKISHSAENLLEIMEGMLLWSKGQMEHFTPAISAVPVQQLFDYIRKYYSSNNQVQFHFEGPAGMLIHTDENYLQTIMQNLTANAVKVLQQNPDAAIWWKAWKENDKTFLSITDNGPGIPPELAKTLFEDTAVSGSRHGLGLHIIRDLSKAIRCDIRVQPADHNTGTCFLLSLA